LDTSVKGKSSQKLSDYINVNANPFRVDFLPRNKLDKTPYFSIKGMLLDSYLNYINVNVKVEANKDFFYENGVYTIWGKDHGTPDEDGKPPAKSMYGAHPFYMYRHAKDSWAGIFTKIAQAQDWFISNNKQTGDIDIKTIAVGGLGDIYVMIDQQEPEDILERYLSIVGDPVLVP
jgi:alpha-glucosidase (family GH31 glycosyl hydrolase)